MEPTSHENGTGRGAGELSGAPEFGSPEDLISLVRRHYASDFPNPKRVGCPGDDVLRATASSGGLPDEGLLAHLFECSDCYRQFQNELAAYRATRPEPRPTSWGRIGALFAFRPVPAFAGALALLLLVVGVAYFMLRRVEEEPARATLNVDSRVAREGGPSGASPPDAPPPELTPSQPSAAPPLPSPPPPSPERPARDGGRKNTQSDKARGRQKPAPRPRHARPSPETALAESERENAQPYPQVFIDLNDYARVRGAGDKRLELPRAGTTLRLRLPEGSVKGRYTISIWRGDRRLWRKSAYSQDGINLTLALSLQELEPQEYTLRLTHEGSTDPDEYTVVVRPNRP